MILGVRMCVCTCEQKCLPVCVCALVCSCSLKCSINVVKYWTVQCSKGHDSVMQCSALRSGWCILAYRLFYYNSYYLILIPFITLRFISSHLISISLHRTLEGLCCWTDKHLQWHVPKNSSPTLLNQISSPYGKRIAMVRNRSRNRCKE